MFAKVITLTNQFALFLATLALANFANVNKLLYFCKVEIVIGVIRKVCK